MTINSDAELRRCEDEVELQILPEFFFVYVCVCV